jgi:hypothetical protein
MPRARIETPRILRNTASPLGNLFRSNQEDIGYRAKAKKIPHTSGTKIKDPSLATMAPKTKTKSR